jgi:hypothetical protein
MPILLRMGMRAYGLEMEQRCLSCKTTQPGLEFPFLCGYLNTSGRYTRHVGLTVKWYTPTAAPA